MTDLNSRVLSLALDQAAVWRAQGQPLTVAVNLSASTLIDAELPEQIAVMVKERGLSSFRPDGRNHRGIHDAGPQPRQGHPVPSARPARCKLPVDNYGTGSTN